MRKAKTANPDAYEAYLKGRYFWNKRDAAGLKKAIDYFQRAIDADPGYAPAYSALLSSVSASSLRPTVIRWYPYQ